MQTLGRWRRTRRNGEKENWQLGDCKTLLSSASPKRSCLYSPPQAPTACYRSPPRSPVGPVRSHALPRGRFSFSSRSVPFACVPRLPPSITGRSPLLPVALDPRIFLVLFVPSELPGVLQRFSGWERGLYLLLGAAFPRREEWDGILFGSEVGLGQLLWSESGCTVDLWPAFFVIHSSWARRMSPLTKLVKWRVSILLCESCVYT